jgi:hypothetical protein
LGSPWGWDGVAGEIDWLRLLRHWLLKWPGLPENKALAGAVEEGGIIPYQVVALPLENCSGSRLLQQGVGILAGVSACVTQTVIWIKFCHGFYRLAYNRLTHVFESPKKIVASYRRNGLLPSRRSGYGNASVAIDIYIEAQEQAGTSSDQVKQGSRVARRWRTLAGPSPIFVIIYSEAVEGFAYALFFIILPGGQYCAQTFGNYYVKMITVPKRGLS